MYPWWETYEKIKKIKYSMGISYNNLSYLIFTIIGCVVKICYFEGNILITHIGLIPGPHRAAQPKTSALRILRKYKVGISVG